MNHTDHHPVRTLGEPLRPAVFLDRDGTLNAQTVRNGKPYPPTSLHEFSLFPDAQESCRMLAAAGYVLVVVTNQPDVGRGTQLQSTVESMHRYLAEKIPEIARIEVCYDSGEGVPSRRRKPAPGMIHDAAAELRLDLSRSWLIGDRWRDVDCGMQAGLRTIFIDFGYAEELRSAPHHTVRSLREAAAIILAHG